MQVKMGESIEDYGELIYGDEEHNKKVMKEWEKLADEYNMLI